MEVDKTPKWQEQVEAILREKFPGDKFSHLLKKAFELVDLLGTVEIPSGDMGQVVAPILKHASEELRPLAAIYAGFQLGVAYERYQNANRA
ncbi:hypothetical protein ES707_10648 [subsurface metagenome]